MHDKAAADIGIDNMQAAVINLYVHVTADADELRQRAVRARNSATNIVTPNFEQNDIVLVRKLVDKGHKSAPRWYEPFRIVGVEGLLVLEVESLVTGKNERAHATSLLPYRDRRLHSTLFDDELAFAGRAKMRFETVTEIRDIGEANDGMFLQVLWDLLPGENELT